MPDVLIVDDQAPFRDAARTLIDLLADWHVVGEVDTGEAAVAAVETRPPELVLMDINLPGIDGMEATKQIVSARPDVRVVLLSTYAQEDLPADALSCGAIAYIRKEELTPRALRAVWAG